MNEKKRKKRNRNRLVRRFLSLLLSFAMLVSCIYISELDGVFEGIPKIVLASTATTIPKDINSLEEFYDFAISYANNQEFANTYQRAKVTINVSGDFVLEDSHLFSDTGNRKSFVPIGTESKPFLGEIRIVQAGGSYFTIKTDKQLFDYIGNSVEILKSGQGDNYQELSIIRTEGVTSNEPLFAKNVVYDTAASSTPAKWHLMASPENATTSKDFSGIIGSLEDGAEVGIVFDNAAYGSGHSANIVSDDNTGLVAGTMGSGSIINIWFKGDNSSYSLNESYNVETNGEDKSAGGLVGKMDEGAKLNVYLLPGTGTGNYYDIEASKEVTASGGGSSYAGGLVGENNGGDVNLYTVTYTGNSSTETNNKKKYISKDVVKADKAAGGIYGIYKLSANTVMNDKFGASGCKVNAENCGGFVGILDADTYNVNFAGVSSSNKLTAASSVTSGVQVSNYGGLVGKYLSKNLAKTLTIQHVTITVSKDGSPSFASDASSFGGTIGFVDGSESGYTAAYVYVDDVVVQATSGYNLPKYFGGIIGRNGNLGSMLDIGSVKLTTTDSHNGGGVVGYMQTGVLRLSGITDMTGTTATKGQIVGTRGAALVYSIGDGKDEEATYNNGWGFKRYNGNQYADDIGSWGEVVRLNQKIEGVDYNIEDQTNGALTFDGTNHTVTVSAPELTMSSTLDIVKTALNMQLNTGDNGSLKFADSENKSANLLASSSLEIDGEISLSGTGITSLTRDDGNNNGFSGTLSGATGAASDKIILATGESYGIFTSGKAGSGEIYAHKYNGLFAKASGGAIQNITVDGEIKHNSNATNIYIGGVVASVEAGVTLSGINAKEMITYSPSNGVNNYVGGVIGVVGSGNANDITINNSTSVTATINASKKIAETTRLAGVIGGVSSVKTFSITMDNATISAEVNATAPEAVKSINMAGLIAEIAENTADSSSDTSDTRTVDLENLSISGLSIKNNATVSTGGLFGYKWHNTNVILNNNSFSNNNLLYTDATKLSALCYLATGYWQVQAGGLNVQSLSIAKSDGTAAVSDYVEEFGFIVNYGYSGTGRTKAAIYLEMQAGNSFTLGSGGAGTGVTVPTMTSGVYDELVAHTSDDVLANKSGVISYYTTNSGTLYMNGSDCNSYQNVFNKTLTNGNSRYYYNVSQNKSNTADQWKTLRWSLSVYAANNIVSQFPDPFSGGSVALKGTMTGVSYYPVDIDEGVSLTISSMNAIIFKNYHFEKSEMVSLNKGNKDEHTRSTLSSDSQHYLMHTGIFRNVKGNINITGAANFKGTIGYTSDYSGAFINGTLTGTVTTSAATSTTITFGNGSNGAFNDNSLQLITIGESAPVKTDAGYLFINKIGSNSTLTLNKVRINYGASTDTYASSLIGDVIGQKITLIFNDIKIDSRTTSDLPSSLTTVYTSKKSIFKNATLLNKFDVDPTSNATYNFTQVEDWGETATTRASSTGVTYGKEITDSVDFAGKEKWYYDTNAYYTDAEERSTSSDVCPTHNFHSGYLPYVRYSSTEASGTTYSGDIYNTLREIKVNVRAVDMTDGCGTYDHPYVIDSTDKLMDLAATINGTTDPIINICLPKTVATQSDNYHNHWCENNGAVTCDGNYTYDSSTGKYKSTTGAAEWELNQVREYLAGAYYQVSGTIIINNSSYVGLGASDGTEAYHNDSGKYAFRGVIVGVSGGTIQNNTTVPFIKISNGCVVKDLTVNVNTGTAKPSVITEAKNSSRYSYTQQYLYYGGLIGEVMGGDNIIDHVKMTYAKNGNRSLCVSDYYLANIGGYVGTVVNGGLIFRNMTGEDIAFASSFTVGNGDSSYKYAESTTYSKLYINPFVGRVINGYAINETNSYSGDTGTYTLDNSNKNYRIADVNSTPGDNIISFGDFTATGANDKLCIPDGQSLFMLSLITQSGAGSASSANGEYAYGVGYDGTTERYDSYSAAQYSATHLADYTYVGNVKDNNSIKPEANTDWTKSCRDRAGSATCVPYIISKYTSGSGESYLARTITNKTYMIELTTTNGDYKLPECFRGIGSICRMDGLANGATTEVVKVLPGDLNDEDGKFVMKIYGMKGNNSKISINLNYKTYTDEKDNYIYTVYESTGTAMNTARNHVGFGLFNYVKQIPQSGKTITTYNTTSGYYIGDFTLSGQVVVKEYNSNGTEVTQTNGYTSTDATGKNLRRHSHSVGGVVGVLCIDDYMNLVNADIEDITISGPYMVGGYIGRVNITERNMQSGNNMNYIFVNGCDTEKTIINCGGGHCGGIVAGSHAGYMCVYVNTATNTNTSDTENRSNDNYYKSSMELSITNHSFNGGCGTSAVIGGIRNGYGVNIWVNNLSIYGYSEEGKCKAKIINDISDQPTTSYGSTTNAVGGYIGYVRKAESVIITNSSVKNLSIEGQNAGGLFGYIDNFTTAELYGTSPKIKIYNCDIFSDDKNDGYSITSANNAGGITGGFVTNKTYANVVSGYDSKNYTYDIDGANVYNYTISGANSCGGLIGTAANGIRSIVNSSVHDCTLRCSDNKAVGGIVGNTSIDISGYNISSYNNVFAGRGTATTTSATKGNFIGVTSSKNIKIVAFSRKNNTYNGSGLSADCGSENGSGGYIVCSDYSGISQTSTANKQVSGMTDLPVMDGATVLLDNVGEGAGKEYFPYANTSPKTKLGASAFVTGDGAYEKLVNKVVSDLVNSESSYIYNNLSKYATVKTETVTRVGTMVTNTDADVYLTTYGNEMGLPSDYTGQDFEILSLGGNQANLDYTTEITDYIKLITNTNSDYTSDVSNQYKIKIWPCRYSGGNYSIITGDSVTKSVTLSNSKYFMNEAEADTLQPGNQFTLIDVQYLNPMNPKEVAYHLFVPVLTKKMVKFEFHSDVVQGTPYHADAFSRLSENNVYAGNFDNWMTMYYQFKYTKNEMDELLSLGKGLNWNSDKILYLDYGIQQSLADSTQLVLLDNNCNSDTAYYLTEASINTTRIAGNTPIDNVVFADFLKNDNSTHFVPHTLNDIAATTMVYSGVAGGKYVECTNSETKASATIYANDQNGLSRKCFVEYVAGETEGEGYGSRFKIVPAIQYTSASSNGVYIECTNAATQENATVYAFDSNGENKKYFTTYEEGTTTGEGYGTRYTVSVAGAIMETYYMSVYTYSSDNYYDASTHPNTNSAYEIIVRCPLTLNGKVTSKRNVNTYSTIYIGNMFTQTMSVSADSSKQIQEGNNYIHTRLSSTISFTDSDDKDYFQDKLNVAGVKIYQGFQVFINRYDDQGHQMNDSKIYETPSYSYTNTLGPDSSTYNEDLPDMSPYIFLEPVEITIPSTSEAPNWSSTHEADLTVTFPNDISKLANEFVTRYGEYAGNGFYAYANLDFTRSSVEYSSMKKGGDSNERYYISEEEKLTLTLNADEQMVDDEYDKYGELSNNRSMLGVNDKYINTGSKYETYGDKEHIEAIANIDASMLPDSIYDDSYSLLVTLELQQKRNTGLSGYSYATVPIDTYLEDFKLMSKDADNDGVQDEITGTVLTKNDGKYYYAFELTGDPEDWLINFDEEQHIFDARVSYDVKTTNAFRQIDEYMYSNYRVVMSAEIVKTADHGTGFRDASDWVVFTHAKVNAHFVEPE